MIKKSQIAVVTGLILSSTVVLGATRVADGRGNGMGNTGVASADYLVSAYYNPALGALYRQSDDVGLLLPAIGANLRDTGESIDTIDDVQDLFKGFDGTAAERATAEQLNVYLDDLKNNKPVTATGGAGIAVAIPSQYVSVNIFGRGYVELIADTSGIGDSVSSGLGDEDYARDTNDRVNNSQVDLVAFGYSEFGIAFSKLFEVQGQAFSVGISPKYQELKTYYQNVNVNDFDLDDYDKSETSDSAFNLDLGAVWYNDSWRLGLAIKDVLKQDITSQSSNYTYELKPQATVAAAYTTRFFTAAIDVDLTKQTRYTNVDDDTQFVRFGVEGNAWDWLQLRAGYEVDTQSTLDDSVTAGIGISPFDVLNIDIAGSYAGDNQYGGSANLAFTF